MFISNDSSRFDCNAIVAIKRRLQFVGIAHLISREYQKLPVIRALRDYRSSPYDFYGIASYFSLISDPKDRALMCDFVLRLYIYLSYGNLYFYVAYVSYFLCYI